VATLAERLVEIRSRIAAAAARAGRDAAEIRLVGASKRQPIETLAEAYAAGLRDFGENRVQEAAAKAPSLPADVRWHLLGPLQTNKAKAAVRLFGTVHALDREKAARALEAEAAAEGRRLRALVEVNLGGEISKHGFAPDGLAEALAPLAALERVEVVGLMAIPPPGPTPEASRRHFRRLRALRDALDRRAEWQGRLVELSMGMSDDFEVAVEEGATFVRIGTRLFGPRAPTSAAASAADAPSRDAP
jgi:pyridoxal phosphate enzyme (YggS family)